MTESLAVKIPFVTFKKVAHSYFLSYLFSFGSNSQQQKNINELKWGRKLFFQAQSKYPNPSCPGSLAEKKQYISLMS